MRFVYPQVLFFLFALALPVVVHLLRLHRYKREYFSNVRLLESLQKEQKRNARLREILVLLARMSTMACLVLAFAQPFLPAPGGRDVAVRGTCTSIYVDNSFSMQASSGRASLLEEAKRQAARILESLPPDASVQVFSNRFAGEEQVLRTPEEAKKYLAGLDVSPVPRSFQEIRDFQQASLDAYSIPSSARVCCYVSDFQQSSFRFPAEKLWADSLVRHVFVPVEGASPSNLAVDSVAFEQPVFQAGRDMGLRVWLTNYSDREQLQVPLRLYAQGRQIGAYPVDFAPGESLSVDLPFRMESSGIYSCYVEIADYPVVFDDRMYFSFLLSKRPKVLHVFQEQADSSVARLYSRDSAFDYQAQALANLDYEEIPASHLVILDRVGFLPSALVSVLASYVREGGSVAVLPGRPERPPQAGRGESMPAEPLLRELLGSGYGGYREEARRVRHAAFSHPVFALALAGEADQNLLPETKSFYLLPEPEDCPYESLMSFTPQGAWPREDFLRAYSAGKGLLYLFASDIGEQNTDFSAHYTFVVLLANMALFQGTGPRLYYTAGSEEGIFLPSALVPGLNPEENYYVQDPVSGWSAMPLVLRAGAETAFFACRQVERAGNYLIGKGRKGFSFVSDTLSSERVEQFSALQPVSFNYDRAESRPACYSSGQIAEWIAGQEHARCYLLETGADDFSGQVEAIGRGRELWKVFVIFALLSALAETVFLRRKRGGKTPSLEKP